MKQIVFTEASFPSGVSPVLNARGGVADIVGIASLTEIGGAKPPGVTNAVRLPILGFSPGGTAWSGILIDLETLNIPNVSRVSAWMGMGESGTMSDRGRLEVTRNGSVVAGKFGDGYVPWTKYETAAASNDDIVFRYRAGFDYDAMGWQSRGGVALVEIYALSDPYMLNQFVTHDGKMWKSKVDHNPSTPGADSLWELALALPNVSGPTASRPSSAAAGAGFEYFDTTLSKPIWSNGTDWVDATGTVV